MRGIRIVYSFERNGAACLAGFVHSVDNFPVRMFKTKTIGGVFIVKHCLGVKPLRYFYWVMVMGAILA